MLQKTVFTLLLVALSGMLFSGCSPRDDSCQWRFEIKKAPPLHEGALGHDIEIKFIRDKNDVVLPPFKNPHGIGFMLNGALPKTNCLTIGSFSMEYRNRY